MVLFVVQIHRNQPVETSTRKIKMDGNSEHQIRSPNLSAPEHQNHEPEDISNLSKFQNTISATISREAHMNDHSFSKTFQGHPPSPRTTSKFPSQTPRIPESWLVSFDSGTRRPCDLVMEMGASGIDGHVRR